MTLFSDEFVKDAPKLSEDGVIWKRNGINILSKLYGVCCCVDAPAKPLSDLMDIMAVLSAFILEID